MKHPSESIFSDQLGVNIGGETRSVKIWRMNAGLMRAHIIVNGPTGRGEAYITLNELRALAKWATRRVNEIDRTHRRKRVRDFIRGLCQ